MSAIIKSEMISRRKALSLMGLAAAFGLAAAPTVLTVSDAEAQTTGMERRQDDPGGMSRPSGAQDGMSDVRSGAQDRIERHEGTNTGAGTTTGAAK